MRTRTWLSHIELNYPWLVIWRIDLNYPGLITLWLDLSSPYLVILALDLELFLSHHTDAWHKNCTILSLCKQLVSSTILKYNTYYLYLYYKITKFNTVSHLVILQPDFNSPCHVILWLDLTHPVLSFCNLNKKYPGLFILRLDLKHPVLSYCNLGKNIPVSSYCVLT